MMLDQQQKTNSGLLTKQNSDTSSSADPLIINDIHASIAESPEILTFNPRKTGS